MKEGTLKAPESGMKERSQAEGEAWEEFTHARKLSKEATHPS